MKAKQTFSVLVDENGKHVYARGKKITINAGDKVPEILVPFLIVHQRAFLDVQVVDGIVQ